ncbi:putative hemolysin [Ruegeria hyattellae]|uniref:putative hemolysin n=1 Tax=Ruegeria hyattellae TaxID=3233337 RepID=UPI00355B7A8B
MSRFLLIPLGLTILAACEPAAPTKPQLANPAATYCIETGAKYEIRDSDDGQVGICTLPDGTEVDAWEYFRENSPA